MRGFEVIRDVTSPLGLKSLNEQLKMLHFRTMNITDKDIRPESIGSIHIQVESIDGLHIKPKSITAEHIKADFITTNHLEAVTARIGHLEATSATISDLNAAVARIRDLEADKARIDELYAIKANITDLDAILADITDLRASKADIEQLDVVNADIVRLTADVGSIKNLLAGNLTAANFQAGAIKAGDAIIADAAISDAMIANVSVSKLLAGDISTNKFRLVSDSGNLLIYDNTIQIQDDNKVRVQIGKDASGDYSMYVWDSDGKLMFDATGLKKDAIKEAIIRDDMIAGDANIDAKKINIRSLFTEMNESGEVLKSSRIVLDTEEQTLDIAFESLKTKVDENIEVTSSYGTKLSVIEGQIQSKIWQTDITQALNSAKQYTDDAVASTVTVIDDKFTQVTQTIDGIQVSIGDLHSEIDNIDQEILAVDNKVVTLSATVDGVSSEITSVKQNYLTKTDAGNIYATQTVVSSLQQSVNGLSSRVSSVETNYLTKTDAQDIYTTKTKTSELEQSLDGVALRVTGVESVVSEHESTLSEAITSINALQGQIELKVEQTDIKRAINEIEVGGRNLLPNSEEEKTNDGSQWRPEFLRTYDLAPIFEKYGLDREYSLSFELKSADTSKNNRIQVYMQSGSGSKYGFINKTVEVTEEYQRFVFEGLKPTKSTGEHNTAHLSFYGTYDTGNVPIVRKIKLELGNKATDWTPAPEDIDQAINTVDTKIDNKVSEINLTLDGITSRVSSTERAINGIAIGGRNLLKGTAFKGTLDTAYWNTRQSTYSYEIDDTEQYGGFNTLKVTANAVGDKGKDMVLKSLIMPEPLTEYVFSFYAKALEETVLTVRWGFGEGQRSVVIGTDWARYEVIAKTGDQAYQDLLPYFDKMTTVWFALPKLEKGTKATDWTPAPEDVDAQLEQLGQELSDSIETINAEYTSLIEQRAGELEVTLTQLMTNSNDEIVSMLRSEIDASVDSVSLIFTELEKTMGDTNEEVNKIKSYFDFSAEEGLGIGRSDSQIDLFLRHNRIEFRDNGTPVAWFTDSTQFVKTLEVVDSIKVGHHIIEKYDNEITVVKWIGAEG